MKNKKFLIIISLCFLAASCNPFKQPLPAGIIKSVNGGVDWQFTNTVKGSTTLSLSGLSISKLSFSPVSRTTLFAGTYSDGLFKSEDSGNSWSKILSKIFVYDFVIDSGNPQIIYASGFFGDHGRVLKTTDGGSSWVQIYNEESSNNPVRSIAVNPNNSNQVIVGMASGTVIKSSDGGQSWQLVKNFNDQVNRLIWQNGNVYLLLKTKGLLSSTDSGQNFNDISGSLNKTYSLAGFSYEQASIGAFSQVFVDLTSPSLIYLTSDKGVYKTVNGGQNWSLQSLPVKESDSSAHAIAVGFSNSNIVYASVGSTIYKSLDAGQSWQTQGITSGGFINYVLVDPQLPQIVYAGIYNTQ